MFVFLLRVRLFLLFLLYLVSPLDISLYKLNINIELTDLRILGLACVTRPPEPRRALLFTSMVRALRQCACPLGYCYVVEGIEKKKLPTLWLLLVYSFFLSCCVSLPSETTKSQPLAQTFRSTDLDLLEIY